HAMPPVAPANPRPMGEIVDRLIDQLTPAPIAGGESVSQLQRKDKAVLNSPGPTSSFWLWPSAGASRPDRQSRIAVLAPADAHWTVSWRSGASWQQALSDR